MWRRPSSAPPARGPEGAIRLGRGGGRGGRAQLVLLHPRLDRRFLRGQGLGFHRGLPFRARHFAPPLLPPSEFLLPFSPRRHVSSRDIGLIGVQSSVQPNRGIILSESAPKVKAQGRPVSLFDGRALDTRLGRVLTLGV